MRRVSYVQEQTVPLGLQSWLCQVQRWWVKSVQNKVDWHYTGVIHSLSKVLFLSFIKLALIGQATFLDQSPLVIFRGLSVSSTHVVWVCVGILYAFYDDFKYLRSNSWKGHFGFIVCWSNSLLFKIVPRVADMLGSEKTLTKILIEFKVFGEFYLTFFSYFWPQTWLAICHSNKHVWWKIYMRLINK